VCLPCGLGFLRVGPRSAMDDTVLGSFEPLGTGMTGGEVRALAVDDSHGLVYAGGGLHTAGGSAASKVAVWDVGLGAWIALQADDSQGMNGIVRALALDDSVVYLGGDFTAAGLGVHTVAADGTFTWSRTTRKKIHVYFRHDTVRSNTVTIRAR